MVGVGCINAIEYVLLNVKRDCLFYKYMNDSRVLLLDPADNVFVAIQAIDAGEVLCFGDEQVTLPERLTLGHKIAARAICAGEKIFKYRSPIGSATRDIALGEHVHLHNMRSDYLPTYLRGEARAISTAHDHH